MRERLSDYHTFPHYPGEVESVYAREPCRRSTGGRCGHFGAPASARAVRAALTLLRRTLVFALLLALCSLLPQQDRIVDANNSGAYPTLQAALAAANPGDRIILRTPAHAGGSRQVDIIDKSVTIKGEVPDPGPDMIILTDGGGFGGSLRITALTPGVPLVWQDVRIQIFTADDGYGGGTGIIAHATGEIIFDNVSIWSRYSLRWPPLASNADLQVSRVSLRRCRFTVDDWDTGDGCCRDYRSEGTPALTFRGQDLFIEDSYLRGGSAAVIAYPGTGCEPGLCTSAGNGGAALLSNARSAVIVRSVLSDGNGGHGIPSMYWVTPTPGSAGVSQLAAPGAPVASYASFRETGFDGRGGANVPRGPLIPLGAPVAPLSLSPTRIGQPFTMTVAPHGGYSPLLAFFGMDYGLIPTTFGSLHIPPASFFTSLGLSGPGAWSFSVPLDPALIDHPFVSQVLLSAWNQPNPVLGNPSMTWFRR